MTDDGTDGAQRIPRAAPAKLEASASGHGHRKLSFGVGTFAGGQVIGDKLLIWGWGQLAIWANAHSIALQPMTPEIASGLFGALTLFVVYKTREETVT